MALLQGIFSTQKSNPHLLHLLLWQVNSLSLCHLGRHTCVCVCVYIYIYHYFFKSKGTVYQCIGMINRLIDRKMNPLLIVPVKQEYKINEEKINYLLKSTGTTEKLFGKYHTVFQFCPQIIRLSCCLKW